MASEATSDGVAVIETAKTDAAASDLATTGSARSDRTAASGSGATDRATSDATALWMHPGALSRFYTWCYRLPWHGWWLFPAMAGVLLVYGHAILWTTGRLAVGTLDPTLTVSVAYGPYALAAIGSQPRRRAGLERFLAGDRLAR